MRFRNVFVLVVSLLTMVAIRGALDAEAADSRFAHSDSDSAFLHHIDLYDAANNKINADSQKPYSPLMTCGRCHDYDTISHGWHFNAFLPDTNDGRQGEPWIWTEERTGTQLPLSYRKNDQLFNPNELGITPWQMTHQFGDRIPGGGVAAPEQDDVVSDRWKLSGMLRIDCMSCHASQGSYDFNARREQIKDDNFAWAATAGLRLGTIDGKVSRIREGADPADESVQSNLPKVDYDDRIFSPDGTVFIDLVRKPDNNACYQCHSQRTVGPDGIEERWMHDQDVHLRAGMACVDCHRNGIDHNTIRGYEGESETYDDPQIRREMVTLSCSGCHFGTENPAGTSSHNATPTAASSQSQPPSVDITLRRGRMGAPQPLHEGLPPVHFKIMSCTTCHSGPVPKPESMGMLTSFAHGLGEKGHRTGRELPRIVAPVFGLGEDGKIYPQRAVWPAFWGTIRDGELTPIDPSKIYDLTRRSLRVRRNFVDELVMPVASRTERKEILGEERASLKDEELTEEELAKIETFRIEAGIKRFNEKVSATLSALENELDAEAVVYVANGRIYKKSAATEGDVDVDVDTNVSELVRMEKSELKNPESVDMVRWPLAHNVRPAGWSLGVNGCLECHAEGAVIFDSVVQAVGPAPGQGPAITMAELRGRSANQILLWNQLFGGRKIFKFLIAGSLVVLLVVLLVGVGAFSSRLVSGNQKSV
ncbi:hypothetical protein Q31b_29430 [Novipirellula aureliae]|uniref:Uncharacterized protein n=1 Tax=Novipirellula aureliae TaxID=2527966 RepID=A0A5C6DZ42_9BACT|nr:hypothetical protein [Novipirellula aureliae]TWU41494.1 hypothetical protein Q31b_29430 [Novipirellula aureliae]